MRLPLSAATVALSVSLYTPAANASVSEFITLDPNSMWFGETWAEYDNLDKTFATLAWATGNILFPCEAWSFNYGPPSPPSPPPYIPPYIPPPPCLDCGSGPIPTPIPETSTWLMLLFGFVALSVSAVRRRFQPC